MSKHLARYALLASTFAVIGAAVPAFAAEKSDKVITLSLREPNSDATLAAAQQVVQTAERINTAWVQAAADQLTRWQYIIVDADFAPGKGVIAGYRTLGEAQAEQKNYLVSTIVDWTRPNDYLPAFRELARREGWNSGLPPEPNPDRK